MVLKNGGIKHDEENRTEFCVNALNGLPSFLRLITEIGLQKSGMCQRPERASFISTGGKTMRNPFDFEVSTP